MTQFIAKIRITLRKGILDVQGKTVENALHSMEFQPISNVRIGKYVELMVSAESKDAAFALVDSACKKLIANPIIEDYLIDMTEQNI